MIDEIIFIREKRKTHKLTLREVENATGVSNAYLSQLENGKIKNPSFNVIKKLTAYYNGLKQEETKCLCPNCRSNNIADASITRHNGIFGPGAANMLVYEAMMCNDCGILFRKITGNGKQ